MIPINDYQKKIYNALKLTGYKVYDEVPCDETMPLVSISDYTFSEGTTKNESYIINQKIDAYSDYEGKKEINEMVSKILNQLEKIVDTNIIDTFFISNFNILESEVYRSEDGFYAAKINIKFEIDKE